MMAARYEHEGREDDPGICRHCKALIGDWEMGVCKLKPNLTAEQIEGEIDNAPKLAPNGRQFLRDEFAMAALTGLMANPVYHRWAEGSGITVNNEIPAFAYKLADAMMDARDAK